MKTKIKDRIKGTLALLVCIIEVSMLAVYGQTAPPVKTWHWHVLVFPLLPPIIYPTW